MDVAGVRLDDLPSRPGAPVDLRKVPARRHGSIGAVRHIVEGQHGTGAELLHPRVQEFVSRNRYLPAQPFVIRNTGGAAIEPRIEIRRENRDVVREELHVAGRIKRGSRSRHSSIPEVQTIFASSTSSMASAGVAVASGMSASGIASNAWAYFAKSQPPDSDLPRFMFRRWLTTMR